MYNVQCTYKVVPAQVDKNASRICYSKTYHGTFFKPHRRQLVLVFHYNIMLQNEEVCGNTIYSSSEASGVNHIIHQSRRLR